MAVAPPIRLSRTARLAIILIILGGIAGSFLSYRMGRQLERERATAELQRRATLRFALTSEILRRHEDTLLALSSVFVLDEIVSPGEFVRAAERLMEHITGAQAIQWVPLITRDERDAWEASIRHAYKLLKYEFFDLDSQRRTSRAGDRPYYYPISYIHPVAGNEVVLGLDVSTGPNRAFLEQARASRRMVVTSQFRLLQEKQEQQGLIVIWPVFRPQGAESAERSGGRPADIFVGFLQSVFRVGDLLEVAHPIQPDAIMDALFVDDSESDPARRVLYFRAAQAVTGSSSHPTEAEFRAGADIVVEHHTNFGGRDWRVYYRPRPDWMESQYTATPPLRVVGILMVTGLLAGLVRLAGRRSQTIRREVELRTAELAESRRQFANMVHALPGVAYRCTYDDQLTVQFVSDGALELTGWSAEEFVAGRAHFRELIHPDDLGRVRESTRASLRERKEVEIEYRIRTRGGQEKWVLSRGRGVYDETGRLDVFEGLAIDVTAQRIAENARLELERKLLEGQKLESLGLLAGGIAHDFNNLLSTILGNAGLARTMVPPGGVPDAQLVAIETASARAAELCRQMLAYAGKGKFVIEPIDLTVLTEELLPLLRISIARHATLQLDLSRQLPAVLVDATQVRQIVMNLVLNAVDAMGERGGEIAIRTGVRRLEKAELDVGVAGAGLPAAEYVFLEVKDTGSGMTPEVMARIFDPFFTTKFAGRGLGLAAVLGIVRGHHGALHVASTPQVGSTFTLYLPPVARAAVTPRVSPSPVAAGRWKRAGQVLIVEDEDAVRLVMAEMLKYFGLTPTTAADGKLGVAAFRANPAGFDLVLLDLLMPGMNGEQVLAAMREIKPDVRVLLMSGYSRGDVLGRLAGPGRLAFLAKPFTRESLEQKLREMLE
jgi:two-component system cell cycle sensor histidine kinase/response regulator CckA